MSETRLTESERETLFEAVRDGHGVDADDPGFADVILTVERILATRLADRDAATALCSQCGELLSVMVKIGTTDGWCTSCLDEAADRDAAGVETLTRPDVIEAAAKALQRRDRRVKGAWEGVSGAVSGEQGRSEALGSTATCTRRCPQCQLYDCGYDHCKCPATEENR